MSRRLGIVLAALVGLVVLLAGLAYAAVRDPDYTSRATLALDPSPADDEDIPGLIGSFNSSGSIGTYVELIASGDTFRAAGSPPVGLAVRAIPDSRVIDVRVEGGEAVVRPALRRIIAVSLGRQTDFKDPWTLRVLQSAQPPLRSGPSTTFVVAAAVLLALLSAIFVLVALTRLVGLERPLPRLEAEREAEAEAERGHARRTTVYR